MRGDIGYGTQTWMLELESKGVRYLFKLRQSKKVKELIAFCELESEWQRGLGKWQYFESQLQLSGWDCPRRVVIYRRAQWSTETSKDTRVSFHSDKYIRIK